MAALRSLLSGLVLSAVVMTGLSAPASTAHTPTAVQPPSLAPAALAPAVSEPMNLAVAMSLPLDDNLPPAMGPNGHLAGSRSAAGMVSRSLTDRIDLAWNPTTGNFLATGKLLSLAGQNRGVDLLWRYNSINDHRPTLSEGTSETALTVGADNSVTYTAADGGTYKFVPKTPSGWTMPAGLNATITAFSATAVTLRFNDTGHTNFYEKVNGVFRLAFTGDQHSNTADRNTYAYDTDGRLATITMANARQVLFEYNDADNTGQPDKITDQSLNRSITIEYGSDGRMQDITDAAGTATRLEYTDGKLVLVRDGLGTRNQLSYDANGKAAKIIYASAAAGATGPATWNLSNDKALGAWRTALKPAGTPGIAMRSFSTAFNTTETATTTVSLPAPAGRAAGDVLIASFTADRNPTVAVPAGWTAIVDALSINSSESDGARLFAYYRVVGASDPADYTWTLSTARKFGGGITAYTGVNTTTPLDSAVVTAVDATYTATSITVGSITTASNGALLIGGLGFDSSSPAASAPTSWIQRWETTGGQITEQADRIQDPAASTTHTLNAVDATTSTLTDTAGRVTTYKFNAARQITSITDPLGNVTNKTFNAHDDQLTTIDALANTTTSVYNPNNTLKNITSPPSVDGVLGGQVSFNYPAATAGEAWLEFHPTSSVDREDQTTSYTYDTVLGLPYQTITPSGVGGTPRKQYQGDAAATTCGGLRGQLCKMIDGKGNTTSITYNAARYPVTITRPAPLGVITNTFDAAGRITTSTDGKAQTATYAYDGNDRLLQTRFGATCVPATCVTYTYDANGNLTTRVDGSGTTTHNYDQQNRPTSKTIGGVTTSLTYDPASNITSFTDPTGTVNYRYDASDRLTALAEPGGSCPTTPVFPNSTKCTGFDYDKNDRRVATRYPNGVKNSTLLDKAGRTVSITATNTAAAVLAKREYTYTQWRPEQMDGALRHSMFTETGALTVYDYDAMQRLTLAQTGTVDETWTYDANGNRLTSWKTGTTKVNWAYNAADQLCWKGTGTGTCATPPAGAETYTFDANGNQTKGGTTTSTWTTLDQLASHTNTSSTTGFTYAGQGNTERLTAGATSFLNGSLGITRQTTAGAGTSFIRDPEGTLISMRNSAGASFYYTTDALGSTILLTDSAQAKAATYLYDAWGNTTSQTGTQAAANPWRYAGGYKDDATGYTKFGARYYGPGHGRFTQADPSGQEQNRYLYAGANPTTFTDASGLFYFPQFSATACFGVCFGVSAAVDWGNGIKFGTTVGIGFRAEAGVGVGAGFGNLNGESASVECSGKLGTVGGHGGFGLTSPGIYGGWSGGIGGGCSIMFTTYR